MRLPSPVTRASCWANPRRIDASTATASRRPCRSIRRQRPAAGRSRRRGLIQRKDLKLLCHACGGSRAVASAARQWAYVGVAACSVCAAQPPAAASMCVAMCDDDADGVVGVVGVGAVCVVVVVVVDVGLCVVGLLCGWLG